MPSGTMNYIVFFVVCNFQTICNGTCPLHFYSLDFLFKKCVSYLMKLFCVSGYDGVIPKNHKIFWR